MKKQNSVGNHDNYDAELSEKEKKIRKKRVIKNVVVCVVAVVLVGAFVAAFLWVLSIGGIVKEPVTDAEGDKVLGGIGKTQMTVIDENGEKRTITTTRSLLTKEDILEEYKEVVNKLKTDAPSFKKTRYQNLPTDEQSFGALGEAVLPIIEKYVTSKSASQPTVYQKGNARELPLKNSSYGCLLDDPEKIKNAFCEILEDGSYKIVMTLIDEVNPTELPEGAAAATGVINGVFEPLSALNEISSISELAFSKINFNYTDCTVVLVYDKETLNVKSLNTTCDIKINMSSFLIDLNAEMIDIIEYSDIVYDSAA